MLHACAARFDMTGKSENVCKIFWNWPKALFSSKKFYKIDTVALSFVFDKYCPIMD